jgi:hypothetical protein
MKRRSTIKNDLFVDEHHRQKIEMLGDPLTEIESHIDFASLAAEVKASVPRPVSRQGGAPAVSDRDDGANFGAEAAVYLIPVRRADGVSAVRPDELQVFLRAN